MKLQNGLFLAFAALLLATGDDDLETKSHESNEIAAITPIDNPSPSQLFGFAGRDLDDYTFDKDPDICS